MNPLDVLMAAMTPAERQAYLAYREALEIICREIQASAACLRARWADPEVRPTPRPSVEEHEAACRRMDMLYADLRAVRSRLEALEECALRRVARLDVPPARVRPANPNGHAGTGGVRGAIPHQRR